MIEPVAGMPQIRFEPWPLLPHELEHAPRGGDADHVQHHRLQRQQQRAERAREQHERDQRDQRDHQREVAVHGVDEVLVLRRQPAEVDVRAGRAHGRAHAVERGATRPRWRRPAIENASTTAAPGRRHCGQRRRDRAVHAGHAPRASLATRCGRGGAVRRAPRGAAARRSRCPIARARRRPCLASPCLAIVFTFESAELQVRRGEHERREHERGAERGDPAPAHDQLRPARPRAAGLVVVANVRPVKARAELAEHDRQQRHRDEHADQRDQHAAVADRAQERKRQRDEREQADRDGRAAEHDRPPGGLPSRARSPRRRSRPWARSSRQRTTISSA